MKKPNEPAKSKPIVLSELERVTSKVFHERTGLYREQASVAPIVITHHRKDRTVLISYDLYRELDIEGRSRRDPEYVSARTLHPISGTYQQMALSKPVVITVDAEPDSAIVALEDFVDALEAATAGSGKKSSKK